MDSYTRCVVCSKEHREQILDNWKSGIISIDYYRNRVGFWNWVSLRQFKLAKFSFCPGHVEWKWNNIDSSDIHTVTCYYGNIDDDNVNNYTEQIDSFVELINRCMKLGTLNADSVVSVLRIKPNILEHLISLRTRVDKIDEFYCIANNCKNLVSIELYPSKHFTISDHDFKIMFKNNPKMRQFKLKEYRTGHTFKVSSTVILALLAHCPDLCELVLVVDIDGLLEDQLLTSISAKHNWNKIKIITKRVIIFQLSPNGIIFDSVTGFSIALVQFIRKFNYVTNIAFEDMTVYDSILYEISVISCLESLKLINCIVEYTATGLKSILENCSMLTELHIDCHSEFVIESLSSYNSSGLQKLVLYNVYNGCTLDNIISILNNHAQLQELFLYNCEGSLAIEWEHYGKHKRTEVRLLARPRREY